MWLSCNGDLLATEECASSSVANTFVAPTLPINTGLQYKQAFDPSRHLSKEITSLRTVAIETGRMIERFSNDCPKSNTKVITATNHNRSKQCDEPIIIPSNYM